MTAGKIEEHAMPAEVVIKAEGLTKRYGANLAVDRIDLEVGGRGLPTG